MCHESGGLRKLEDVEDRRLSVAEMRDQRRELNNEEANGAP
jgi:hypothetical protein